MIEGFHGFRKKELALRRETLAEGSLDGLVHLSAAIPLIGGIISSVASGASTGRKFDRLREAVSALNNEIDDLLGQIDDVYVRSDDFEELAEEIFKKIRDTHSVERRRVLLNFLENDAIKGSNVEYDLKIKLLRYIDEVDPQLLLVLDAMTRPTDSKSSASLMGSVLGTIQKKLSDQFRLDLNQALKKLASLGLVQDNVMWGATVTADTANDTNRVTGDGAAFISYIRNPLDS